MWKDYSSGFIKRNRASSISIIVAALIATLFLSLISSLYYNFWVYEIEQIVLDEGNWQARITGELAETDITAIQNFANVEQAAVNEDLSSEQAATVDLTFQDARTIFEDMPLITERLGLTEDAAEYHLLLLSRYLIHDPADPEPPMLLAFYLVILLVVSFSLVLIIHNSFAVSMNSRIHQFGIFSSIGATPGQIRTCLMQEAVALCSIPVLAGSVFGAALSFLTIWAINRFAGGVAGRHEAVFQYHPLVFFMTVLASVLTIIISAWLPARRLSKLTPLQAIRNTGELQLKKKKRSRILAPLFGIEGELAGNALEAQKKALRTSTLSLTLSFLGFTMMLCFFTLSGISTNHTYFERYQDAWDVMITVKDTRIADFRLTNEMNHVPDAGSCVVYQKASSISTIPAEWQSDELAALGGLSVVAGSAAPAVENGFTVEVPLVILDDDSFLGYCGQTGVTPRLDGSILLNRIWDSVNSNFRYKEYVSYLKETISSIRLQNMSDINSTAEISILGFTQEPPVLREEYDHYSLVQFIPLSLWNQISGQIGGAETDTYIRVLSAGSAALDSLNDLEGRLTQIVSPLYEIESENRIQEKVSDESMNKGAMAILGAFCTLLAVIGIANVFSNTMGFLRQRKREFAQYMSVGMTTEGMKKLFCIEAFVIAGRPLIFTLPVTVMVVSFLISASHLNPMEFIVQAPVIPILIFILAIFGCVALAYYIGGKRVLRYSLVEALRDL